MPSRGSRETAVAIARSEATAHAGVFAGGDVVSEHGRSWRLFAMAKAAESIAAYVAGGKVMYREHDLSDFLGIHLENPFILGCTANGRTSSWRSMVSMGWAGWCSRPPLSERKTLSI